MEADVSIPVVAPADGAAAAAAPESAAEPAGPVGYSKGSFSDYLSQAFASLPEPDPADPAVSSGADAAADPDEDGDDTDGEQSAEPVAASVSPSETPGTEAPARPLSRREQERLDHQNEIARLTAENATLAAEREADAQRIRDEARAEYEAEQARTASAAEQQAIAQQEQAEVALFTELSALPTDHERLFETRPDGIPNWQWLDDRRKLLLAFPKAEKHHQIQARQFVEQKAAELEQGQTAFWVDVRSQMADVAAGLGIDMKAEWDAPGKTWKDIGKTIEHASDARATERVTTELMGRVEKAEAEALRLTKENQDLQSQLLGTAKAPAAAGRSSAAGPDKPEANYGGTWQDNLHAAFG